MLLHKTGQWAIVTGNIEEKLAGEGTDGHDSDGQEGGEGGLKISRSKKSRWTHQQMSGSKNYGTFKQWNSMQKRERRSSYPCDSMDGIGEHYAK